MQHDDEEEEADDNHMQWRWLWWLFNGIEIGRRQKIVWENEVYLILIKLFMWKLN